MPEYHYNKSSPIHVKLHAICPTALVILKTQFSVVLSRYAQFCIIIFGSYPYPALRPISDSLTAMSPHGARTLGQSSSSE